MKVIDEALENTGLKVLGSFPVQGGDRVPEILAGTSARTLVLVGNAGPGMWLHFSAARGSEEMHGPLDAWTEDVLSSAAETLGARALFPFTRPYLPFQRWAERAGAGRPSPVGINLHPRYGLWWALRGALAFGDQLDVPPPAETGHACESCAGRPCLATCPVDALREGTYDVAACRAHLARPEGADCMALGCRARRACPIGPDYRYAPAQARFHMRAFLAG